MCVRHLRNVIVILSAVALAAVCAARVDLDPANLSALRMVRIDVTVHEVAHTKGSELGIIWDWKANSGADLLDSAARFPIKADSRGNAVFSILDLKYGVLTAEVQAAMDRGNATVVSRPRVIVRDGQPAEIAAGNEVPFTTLSTIGNALPQSVETQYRQTGVTLNVTPRILPLGPAVEGATQPVQKIALLLRPSVSDITRTEKIQVVRSNASSEVYDLPVIAQRSVDSIVIVRDGQTLVLGGLLEERAQQRESGVPYLKDIRWVGMLFRSSNERTVTTEIIMYVTPTIVDPNQQLADAAGAAASVTGAAAASTTSATSSAVAAADTGPDDSNLVVVVGSRMYVETGGDTPFLGRRNKIVATGQVQNRSPQRVTDVMIEAALYDDLGNLLDVVNKQIGQLRGQQTRPFRVEFSSFDNHFRNTYIASEIRYKTYYNF